MNTTKIETELVNIIQYSDFSTVGELKEILSKYPDNLNFGFRNQPFQNLNYIKNKDNSFESLCFQEPDELDNIIQKKLNPINIGITLIESQNIINTLTEHCNIYNILKYKFKNIKYTDIAELSEELEKNKILLSHEEYNEFKSQLKKFANDFLKSL